MALYYRFLFRIIHWFSDSLISRIATLKKRTLRLLASRNKIDVWIYSVYMCMCVCLSVYLSVCEWESEFVFLYWYVSKRLICIWFISPTHSLFLCSLAFDWCFEKLHRTVRGARRTRKNDILTGLQPNWKHAGHIEASFALRSQRFIHFN